MLIVIQLLNKFVVGFTCREIALLLSDIPSVSQRVQVLQSMSTMVLDSEHRWITLDVGFSSCTSIIKEQVASSLQTWSILPRSFIFGTVIGKCVCFVLDTSSSMECTFVTCQGERISRLRFVVRELSKILRHQMNPSTRFNIVGRCFKKNKEKKRKKKKKRKNRVVFLMANIFLNLFLFLLTFLIFYLVFFIF